MPQLSHILRSFALISRRDIEVKISTVAANMPRSSADSVISRVALAKNGIVFLKNTNQTIEANVSNVVSTQRNTVLSNGDFSLCLVEHFMAAAALSFIDSLVLELDTDELPFGDGSALFWLDALRDFSQPARDSQIELRNEIYIEDPNDSSRNIRAIPSDDNFKMTYCLDMTSIKSPIGFQEYSWQSGIDSSSEIAAARTFAAEIENQILGLSGKVLGYTEDSFTMPLRHPLEPAQHKALDLLGDMYLSGINPLDIKMQVISNKGGHSLNIELAKELQKLK